MSIQIVGCTYIYDNLKSYYKIVLKEKEEAIKFYKYIKALFILQSELAHKYKFIPKIDRYGMLDLYFEGKRVTYEKLPEFIKNEYNRVFKDINDVIDKKFEKEKELEEKKIKVKQQEIGYYKKEKEIALYLECKKSFLGKIKYFFKHKKLKKEEINENKNQEKTNIEKEEIEVENKKFLTIEDLINVYKRFLNKDLELKNLNLDITAIDSKIEMLERKIKNATQYINEIDKHNKSIFDFWKFTNKDENLALEEGSKIKEEVLNKLEKTFEFETDFEEVGKKADIMQRKVLNKSECESVYLTQTDLIKVLNCIKKCSDKKFTKEDKKIIEDSLNQIKKQAEEDSNLYEEEFNIFGGFQEDNTKIKYIKGKKHRENKRNKFEILNINKNTSFDEYKDSLETSIENIKKALDKIKAIENMPIYKCSNDTLNKEDFQVLNINIENAINSDEKIEYLYKINLKENKNVVYLSNIIYFDNKNNTLPEGMDISDKVLIDLDKFELELVNKDVIRINVEDGLYNNVRTLNVYEYELK